jgi:hypothetical protein
MFLFPISRGVMKTAFVILLLACATPALAQGVSNSRDGSGNLVRDKGLASGNVQPQPMVNRSTNQPQKPVVIVRQPPATVNKPVQ